jgi:hypothetical protein
MARSGSNNPGNKLATLLNHIAKSERSLANEFLTNNSDIKQNLLKSSKTFEDPSHRIFTCTAFEYAYWSKDIHTCRMLVKHMDEETKIHTLAKIEEINNHGLQYDLGGVTYQSSHFDFTPLTNALNNFSEVGDESHPRVQALTSEQFFYNNSKALLDIGMKQCQLPAHIVQEYCREDRPFVVSEDIYQGTYTVRQFDEDSLPEKLDFRNFKYNKNESWYKNDKLGTVFALFRAHNYKTPMIIYKEGMPLAYEYAKKDLEAILQLDKQRSKELSQLQDDLHNSILMSAPAV